MDKHDWIEDLDADSWVEEGIHFITAWDEGDRSEDVVRWIECEGIVERRELEAQKTPEQKEREERDFQQWLRGKESL